MRTVQSKTIIEAVVNLCIETNCIWPSDLENAILKAYDEETSETGRYVLENIKNNALLAKEHRMPMCQDTGMAVFFVTLGHQVCVEDRPITEAITEGVKKGYEKGYLRKSVVKDPFTRENTQDNTPAVIHYDFERGDQITIRFAPKGFGSENMSALAMLKPSDGMEGVEKFVLDTVKKAGANPCPPIVVGVGVGGTMEQAAILAKRTLTFSLDRKNDNPVLNKMENRLCQALNATGIGPAGYGGRTTALRVHVAVTATHIAGLPVAVNINCHAARHATVVI